MSPYHYPIPIPFISKSNDKLYTCFPDFGDLEKNIEKIEVLTCFNHVYPNRFWGLKNLLLHLHIWVPELQCHGIVPGLHLS
jgi:hypothetical protein